MDVASPLSFHYPEIKMKYLGYLAFRVDTVVITGWSHSIKDPMWQELCKMTDTVFDLIFYF